MKKTVIIGIGSPHGPDRAGWLAVEQLQHRCCALGNELPHQALEYRVAKVPHEVLDWFNLDTPTHIIDACQSNSCSLEHFAVSVSQGELCLHAARGQVPAARQALEDCTARVLANLRSGSTHHIDLPNVLLLADQLGRLPQYLTLWTIPICDLAREANDSPAHTQAISDCVDLLIAKLMRG